MKRFGVMMDCGRNGIMKPQQIKSFARILKSFGYNMLQIYTEDTYEVDGEPYFGYMRGRYTQEELRDVVDYCNSIGVEVIPCIQTLAHLETLFRWNAYKPINDTGDTLLIGEERTYELIENMFKTVKKCFHSEYIHVGMDEAFFMGRGAYERKHGVCNRFDILRGHLERVKEIAKKYDLKPLIWSDMFFCMINNGPYVVEYPTMTEEAKNSLPDGIGVVYWDYYRENPDIYDRMITAHKELADEVWYAGGAWSWWGFASGNKRTMETMFPAMDVAKKQGIENIMITLWGEDGKDCSYFSLLPSLYAVKRYYDGERDMEKVKAEFEKLTGESFDGMCDLDLPNYVGGNQTVVNDICKYMLYNDPFCGVFDSTVVEGVGEEYRKIAQTLRENGKKSKSYGYLFESNAALCDTLAIKYDLGMRTRKAYRAGDKDLLKTLVDEYQKAGECLEKFFVAFRALWYKENKPQGMDAQEIRLGGLQMRLRSCRDRLLAFLNGEMENIPELEEELLDYHGGGKEFSRQLTKHNVWMTMSTPSRMVK